MPGLALTMSLIRKSHRFLTHRSTTRTGVPAVTANKNNLADFLEEYFFPGRAPTVTLSGGTEKEIGYPGLSVVLSWSVSKGSANIRSITLDGAGISPVGGNQSGTRNTVVSQDTDKTFILTAEDFAGNKATAQTTVSWKYPGFFGASALDLTALRLSLENNYPGSIAGLSKILSSSKVLDQTYDCTGGRYIYVLYPYIYGIPGTVKNGAFDFSDFRTESIVIKDIGGKDRNYILFFPWDIANGRQLQYFGSAVNINITG